MAFSRGIWANNHSCEIRSKQERMSPSKIHSARSLRQSAMKHASMASAVERPRRNPYEFGSAVVSAAGSSESRVEGLHGSITQSGNRERPLSAVALGNIRAPQRLGPISSLAQSEKGCHLLLRRLPGFPINARGS